MSPSRSPSGFRLGLLVAAAIILITSCFALVPAMAADSLLSQGRQVTVSSSENAAFGGGNAVDGNAGSRWASAFADPQWIQVDLGASAAVSRVVLSWEAAYGRAFQIQTSADGANWTPVYSTTTGTGGTQDLAVTGTGRYVRMYGTQRATAYGFSLWEFQVYGSTGTAPGCDTANAALGRPATASSTENAAFPAANAVDGNAGTRWASASGDPQWIQIDLGSVKRVCGVTLIWEAAYARSFQIQTSTDANSFTTIYSTTTGTGGTQDITVDGTGRYVRVYATQRATPYGDSLFEVIVHTGVPATPTPPVTPTGDPVPPDPGLDRLLSYGKPGVASSSQSDGNCFECTPARAFDRDLASRWATSSTTGWVDPGWIYVDLGATAQIHKVILQWDPAYAKSFQIQTSPDAANWTPIYSTTTGTGFKQTLTVNGTGRYVRMYGTQRSSIYGYSLWEFQVWGTGGAPITPPALPADPRNPPQLVWSDEFNTGAGTKPDASKWRAETGPGVNNELQYYTDNANATTDGAGNLVMEARKETTAGSACPGGPCQYTSSRINTYGKFNFTYGRVEARIKVSGTKGLWPAFWLLGADFFDQGRPWPYVGEIDIMEHLGREPQTVYSTIHAPAYFGGGGFGSPYSIAGDFASDFHVFAVDWNSQGMRFTVDGATIHTVDRASLETTRGPWVFDHPFFIILNNAVGGDWPGPPDATTVFPQKMLVDYVRVYQ
ncbi:discoidin domain-containing protein [Sphaerisporangium corydalis]|uniref:Discoidin domain-containing protein n=1 Tax=Sphaerisporangium corydalis TaxID=1441875 RepID=A0ABV9E8G3_9ACTN|nr:discoidin domain-containing protein [Sphaerisporangium corydalis]